LKSLDFPAHYLMQQQVQFATDRRVGEQVEHGAAAIETD
jgi:hypothetical protein